MPPELMPPALTVLLLMTFEDYPWRAKQRCNIAGTLAMPVVAELELDAPRAAVDIRPVDFS